MAYAPEARIEVLAPSKDQADIQFRDACAALLATEGARAYASLRQIRVGGLTIKFRAGR